MFFGDDKAPIRAPARLIEQAEVFLGQLTLIRAVNIHDPDIVTAPAIRHKSDALTIGRKARLVLIGQALSNPHRLATGDRHGVNIAQQVKGDSLAIG